MMTKSYRNLLLKMQIKNYLILDGFDTSSIGLAPVFYEVIINYNFK